MCEIYGSWIKAIVQERLNFTHGKRPSTSQSFAQELG